jgi:hypothetical protein
MNIFCLYSHPDLKFMRNSDTGFGNRLIFWMHSYILSNLIKESKVIILYEYWPEALLLDFPNTIAKKLSKFEKKNAFPINKNQYEYILKTKDVSFLDNKKNYYLDLPGLHEWDDDLCVFYQNKFVWQKYYHESISKIKLKNCDAEEFFKKEFKDFCWVHMRRENGTYATEEFLRETKNTFSDQDYFSYWNTYNIDRCIRAIFYKTTTDKSYFELFDNVILKENKNKKIYISSDVDIKYFSHYLYRYENNIISRDYFFKKFLKFYKEEYFIKKKYNPSPVSTLQLFYNIFDLFVGINSDIVITSNSTWSYIPLFYHKQKKYIWLYGDDIVESNIVVTETIK